MVRGLLGKQKTKPRELMLKVDNIIPFSRFVIPNTTNPFYSIHEHYNKLFILLALLIDSVAVSTVPVKLPRIGRTLVLCCFRSICYNSILLITEQRKVTIIWFGLAVVVWFFFLY